MRPLPLPRLRLAADTGGTFTDLVVEGDSRGLRFYKAPTTPQDPVDGLLDVIGAAATDLGCRSSALLRRADLFVFGTTHATNAVLTGTTARTAFLTTQGHPDILLFREGGGRTSLFDYSQEYPDSYIPRALTFEVPGRILSDGSVRQPLEEFAVIEIAERLITENVEAAGVCLLWSTVNPEHELRVGELLDEHAPSLSYTLSHRLNSTVREYRRASSAVIDASLKPLMSRFFRELEARLVTEGFGGELLVVTSAGGVLDASSVAAQPIHSIGSGPAVAPVAGRHFARLDAGVDTALVTDAGGTTYDVSLVRQSRVPWTRESFVGHPSYGYMTGFPSVDVKSVGAGGGSIAWVDEGGLLHVGPQSSGAVPGPACYAAGGDAPTVTDACVVLGYIDPDYFLGGKIRLRADLAAAAVTRDVARPLGIDLDQAAHAVYGLAIERMVNAIEGITLAQGIDPATAVMVGGGGGAGLYSVGIARRLGCPRVVVPAVSAALSATGALLSDLQSDFRSTGMTSTAGFDYALAADRLRDVRERAEAFVGLAKGKVASEIRYSVEARYPHQVWEIEVPLRKARLATEKDVDELVSDFHATHRDLFAVHDIDSPVEVVTWCSHAACSLRTVDLPHAESQSVAPTARKHRDVFFPETGRIETLVIEVGSLPVGQRTEGPMILQSRAMTVVVDQGAACSLSETGSLIIYSSGSS